jgi:hypothetical protein
VLVLSYFQIRLYFARLINGSYAVNMGLHIPVVEAVFKSTKLVLRYLRTESAKPLDAGGSPNTTLKPTGIIVLVEVSTRIGACGQAGRRSAWGR